jgi:hypothetical protein
VNQVDAGGTALARCVACDVATFAAEHWGRAPRLTRAADLPTTFDDLFDADAVDELVSRRGLRTPFLRMAKEGSVLPANRFTRSGGAGASIGDQAADDLILARMDDGATLVLQALHRAWPPLVDFGSTLSAELGHPVQINAYITPHDNRGFAAHYDVHDVFVLQVAGRKRWRIYAPVVPDPLADQPWEDHRAEVAARAEGEPLIDAVLEPGDALYLPRGTIHEAEALGELSIHLTVGVHPLTRYDVVRHLLTLAEQRPQLRTSLPMGVDLADPGALAPHLAEVVDELRVFLADAPVGAVADRLGADLMARTRPEAIGPLAQLAAVEGVGLDSLLRRRAGLRLRSAEDAESVTLTVLGRTINLPAHWAEAIKYALQGEVFRPAELPGLNDDDRLDLARRLLREGVLVVG